MKDSKQAAQLLGSKLSDDWGTDPEVFAALDDEFHFTLDVNADIVNHKCSRYFTLEQDALKQRWAPERCFCNPPFSKNDDFVRKGKEEANRGALVVFLIPARTNVRWFHNYVWSNKLNKPQTGVEIRFYPGRLPYIGSHGDAPFPVMLVVFRPGLPL
jgi:phage N-6-adenine-methyltransferase